ncbi:MAG: tetratricopeptide repeat protein [Deltaproteobacteria bacterium]|nr:tetratricopeptide repeat protein [Deltaproteobacteria bacterium]
MHPDLLNNPVFLRYYGRWQADPRSAAFVGVADFLRQYQLFEDARKVCEEGLRHNPDLVSGRLVLAHVLAALEAFDAAGEQIQWILFRRPDHPGAKRLLATLGDKVKQDQVRTPWATVTMARLYARQGHPDQAEKIYQLILAREPENSEAKEGLESLGKA